MPFGSSKTYWIIPVQLQIQKLPGMCHMHEMEPCIKPSALYRQKILLNFSKLILFMLLKLEMKHGDTHREHGSQMFRHGCGYIINIVLINKLYCFNTLCFWCFVHRMYFRLCYKMCNSQNAPAHCELLTIFNCILLEIQNADFYTSLHTNHSTCSNTTRSIINHFIKDEQKPKLCEWTS